MMKLRINIDSETFSIAHYVILDFEKEDHYAKRILWEKLLFGVPIYMDAVQRLKWL